MRGFGHKYGNSWRVYLQKETEQINLFEIMDTMERTMKWNRCLEDDRYCSCFATEACRLRETYLNAGAF